MQINSSELIGDALDWAVTRCKGWTVDVEEFLASQMSSSKFTYSAVWAKGGPIIEAEHICLSSWYEKWEACASHGETAGRRVSGPTALVAAMRCYVLSRLGSEVDIPDELLS